MAFTQKDIKRFCREGFRGSDPDIRYEKDHSTSGNFIQGFGLRTSPKGKTTWTLDYRPYSLDPATGEYRTVRRARRVKLGNYPSMTLALARQKALRTVTKIEQGIDPLERSPQEGLTLKVWAEAYLADKLSKTFRSLKEMTRRIRKHIIPAFGNKRLVDITTSDVYDFHKRIGEGPRKPHYEANRNLSRLSDIFTQARKAGKLPKGFINPCIDVEPYPEEKRERVLSIEEAQALMDAVARTEHHRFESLVWLLKLTGIRISEARTLKWSDIELDRTLNGQPAPRMTIRKEHTKNKQPLHVPISEGAVLVLNQILRDKDNDFLFPSPQQKNQPYANQPFRKTWDRVRMEADLYEGDKRIRWHDLRRTFLTIGNTLNYPLHTLGRLVGQKTLSVTAGYAVVESETGRLAADSISEEILSDLGEPKISSRIQTRTRNKKN